MPDVLPTVDGDSGPVEAKPVIGVDKLGNVVGFGSKGQYTLLSNITGATTGAAVGPISGGDYIWRTEAGGTFVNNLEFLGLDGVTWFPVLDSSNAAVTMAATGSKAIGVAQGSVLRSRVTGSPTSLYSSVAGL